MEAKIDKANCIGCGICEGICPDGIEMKNNIAEIKNENAECLQKAADACPRNAIILNEKDSGRENIIENQEKGMENCQGKGMGNGSGMGNGQGRGMGNGQGRGMGGGRGRGNGQGRGIGRR